MPNIPTYNQADPAWATKMLDGSPFNMAAAGCYITSIAMVGWALGHTDTPGTLCDAANLKGLIGNDGMFSVWLISQIWNDVEETETQQTDLYKGTMPIKTAINNIIHYLSEGLPVIVQLDLSPHNGINQGDHFAVIPPNGWNNGDPLLKDPFWGIDTTLGTPHDGFAGYGKPEQAIYGYRVFNHKQSDMSSPVLKENTLCQLVEGSGGFGLYANKKLYIDDTSLILASWEVRNGGDTKGKTVALTLKDWNSFSHYNLKDIKLN